jgi:hypothetical protein
LGDVIKKPFRFMTSEELIKKFKSIKMTFDTEAERKAGEPNRVLLQQWSNVLQEIVFELDHRNYPFFIDFKGNIQHPNIGEETIPDHVLFVQELDVDLVYVDEIAEIENLANDNKKSVDKE